MHRLTRPLTILFAAIAVALTLSACDTTTSATQKEDTARQHTYSTLTSKQPAASMGYSPTRETKNRWIKTWDDPSKLSYVYLLNAAGDTIGYYVLTGLPVSYCTSLIPPYTWVDRPGDGSSEKVQAPAPSVDGTYSSGSNCAVFYGFDATSGAYIEYTTGQGINALVYDQPLPRFKDAEPLGQARQK
ncbi:hypothetical protein [Mumia sp. DW29H23]|uniref:hypothetical protein n=1 Tax=Mumia sp. DW29H23 TaxID=3421241 RepID=UPI003D683200